MILAGILKLVASFFRVGIQRGLRDRLYRVFGVIGGVIVLIFVIFS
jgi:hypothetical protein